ncbi:MAG TPA: isopeptide-forming domain-containing fimbrial protein [Herpetosiphonaceae bacterium]
MRQPSKSVAWIFCTFGLLCLLAGWGGSWGVAYGQTAGPTPTGTPPTGVLATKSVSTNNPNPGQQFTFTIQVANNQGVEQPDVVIEDQIADILEIVSVTSTKGTVTVNGQNVRVDVGTLQPGETVTVTITVRVRQTVPNGTTTVNVARVTMPPPGPAGTPGPGTPSVPPIVTTASNPVAIAVGTAGGPPSGLPNTGASGESNGLLLALGGLLVLIGAALLVAQRRRPAIG